MVHAGGALQREGHSGKEDRVRSSGSASGSSPDVVSQLMEAGWALDVLAWAEGGGGGRASWRRWETLMLVRGLCSGGVFDPEVRS